MINYIYNISVVTLSDTVVLPNFNRCVNKFEKIGFQYRSECIQKKYPCPRTIRYSRGTLLPKLGHGIQNLSRYCSRRLSKKPLYAHRLNILFDIFRNPRDVLYSLFFSVPAGSAVYHDNIKLIIL